jgi:hypothetical protein
VSEFSRWSEEEARRRARFEAVASLLYLGGVALLLWLIS